MTKYKVGDKIRFKKDYWSNTWKKGQVYRVLRVDCNGKIITFERPDGWRVEAGIASSEIQDWMRGMSGYHIEIPEEYYAPIGDKCGKCSSSCRSDKGKCGLYSEVLL
jgi:hypothetical protein